MNIRMLIMNDIDNVGVVVAKAAAGDICIADNGMETEAAEAIEFGHKIALKEIAAGEDIIKYGEVIGYALKEIKVGDWVHIHNMDDVRGREGKLS